MAKLKIQVFEGADPSATITVPGWLVKSASKILPLLAGKQLKEHNIDFDQIIELMKNPDASGVILEVEDHKDNERVVISIVGDEDKPSRS